MNHKIKAFKCVIFQSAREWLLCFQYSSLLYLSIMTFLKSKVSFCWECNIKSVVLNFFVNVNFLKSSKKNQLALFKNRAFHVDIYKYIFIESKFDNTLQSALNFNILVRKFCNWNCCENGWAILASLSSLLEFLLNWKIAPDLTILYSDYKIFSIFYKASNVRQHLYF